MITAQQLLIDAPAHQLGRAMIIHGALRQNRHADAVFSLINAAQETRGTPWSLHCIELAEWSLNHIDRHGSQTEQTAFIAGLLDLHGQRIRAQRLDIDAAVILANTHLAAGKSPSGALSEGYKILRMAKP